MLEWLADRLSDLRPDGVRVAAPVATRSGRWVCDGWSATRWLDGVHPDPSLLSTWVEVVAAGRAFHRAVAHLDRPDCLDRRSDVWARADRVAWDERPVRWRPELRHLADRLRGAVRPLGPSQLVHGDLTGNVLLAPPLAPAVIDVSPYWRPPEYADAVVVADALCWHGAPAHLLVEVDVSVAAVARALLFRMATTNELLAAGTETADAAAEAQRCSRAARAIGL